MRFFIADLFVALALIVSPSLLCSQTPPQLPLTAPEMPSTVLRPGLDALGASLESVRTERWKLSQPAREEVQANLGSIHHDLEGTLPQLLAVADKSPSRLTAMLPLSRNITALYDVLLRLVERAKVAAPADQLARLDQARSALDLARRALDENLQNAAAAEELTLQQAQTRLNTQAVCPTLAPVKKKKKP